MHSTICISATSLFAVSNFFVRAKVLVIPTFFTLPLSMRVVVTGIGLVTPLGRGASTVFSNLVNKKSGIVSTKHLEVPQSDLNLFEQLPCKVVGAVPNQLINENSVLTSTEQKRLARFSQFAVTAAHDALTDARWMPQDTASLQNTGVCIGSCIGSIADLYENAVQLETRGYRKVQPLFVPKYLNNMAAGAVSIKYGFQGPLHTVSTACATGNNAIGDAYRFVKDGYCDVMLAGASEAINHPISVAGFSRLKSLTTNPDPQSASRPFDVQRNGFVLGEGSGVLVLESLEHALNRGLSYDDIYGEIVGYGLSSDAHHITAPAVDGSGARRAMEMVLKHANIEPSKVQYVNAHATSTKLGDNIENSAIKAIFGKNGANMVVASNKGSFGHLLGAAGAVESAVSLLAMKNSRIPPTLNCETPGNEIGDNESYVFNYAANEPVDKKIEYCVSNSFGFGGVNASLAFKNLK